MRLSCLVLCLLALGVSSCSSEVGGSATVDDDPVGDLDLIPVPRSVSVGVGHMHLEASSSRCSNHSRSKASCSSEVAGSRVERDTTRWSPPRFCAP